MQAKVNNDTEELIDAQDFEFKVNKHDKIRRGSAK